jgi:hypothetical protein
MMVLKKRIVQSDCLSEGIKEVLDRVTASVARLNRTIIETKLLLQDAGVGKTGDARQRCRPGQPESN